MLAKNCSRKIRNLNALDLLTATSLVVVLLVLATPLSRIAANPYRLVESLGYQGASTLALVCLFGVVGFPVAILGTGFLLLRRCNSPLRALYAVVTVGIAVFSVYFALVVGSACAHSVGGG